MLRMLFVDDEVEFLESMSEALSRRGFVVDDVEDGLTALRLLEDRRYDVVVLDVKMPGIDGEEVYERIRRRHPDLPVILLTGHGTVEQAFRTSKSGLFEYLTKPCEVEKLAAIARCAVEQSQGNGSDTGTDESIRVLLVDDGIGALTAQGVLLQRCNLHTKTAHNILEARQWLRSTDFDVLVADLHALDENGTALVESVRQLRPTCEIIFMADRVSIEEAVESVQRGAFELLLRPLRIEVLVLRIREAARLARKHRQELLRPPSVTAPAKRPK